MNKRPPTIAGLLVIAGFALSCIGLLIYLWLAFGGATPLKAKGYRFDVAFPDATQLAEQAEVRVAGVPIGKVVDKRLAPEGNRTLATIEVSSQYAPVRVDARAILRQKTLLGETYVEMTLGDRRSSPIAEGGRLADQNVADTVEFDELLRIFDRPTRIAFRQWQASSAQAGAGRAQDLSDALGNLPAFAENAQGVVGVLRDRRETLAALVSATGSTFEAITRNEDALRGLITDSERVFGTLSQRRDALAQSIRILPTFLRESRATLTRLSAFSRDTTPVVRDLEPVLRDARPTVASLRALAPDLRALFEDLPALISAGDRGLPSLARVLRGLDPTLASLGPFLAQLNPILEFLELQQPTVSDFLGTGPSALGLKIPPPPGSQSNGHALPQLIMVGSQTLPAVNRTADNRGNAYIPPGGLADPRLKDPRFFTLPSFDCDHVGGPKAPTDTPGCFVAPDVTFQGKTGRFPNVLSARPGGGSRNPRPGR